MPIVHHSGQQRPIHLFIHLVDNLRRVAPRIGQAIGRQLLAVFRIIDYPEYGVVYFRFAVGIDQARSLTGYVNDGLYARGHDGTSHGLCLDDGHAEAFGQCAEQQDVGILVLLEDFFVGQVLKLAIFHSRFLQGVVDVLIQPPHNVQPAVYALEGADLAWYVLVPCRANDEQGGVFRLEILGAVVKNGRVYGIGYDNDVLSPGEPLQGKACLVGYAGHPLGAEQWDDGIHPSEEQALDGVGHAVGIGGVVNGQDRLAAQQAQGYVLNVARNVVDVVTIAVSPRVEDVPEDAFQAGIVLGHGAGVHLRRLAEVTDDGNEHLANAEARVGVSEKISDAKLVHSALYYIFKQHTSVRIEDVDAQCLDIHIELSADHPQAVDHDAGKEDLACHVVLEDVQQYGDDEYFKDIECQHAARGDYLQGGVVAYQEDEHGKHIGIEEKGEILYFLQGVIVNEGQDNPYGTLGRSQQDRHG